MNVLAVGVFGLAAALAGPAAAQGASDFVDILAAATEGFGQTLGEAAQGGQTVFVTAHGRARLPGPLSGSYFVNVEGRAARAVDAARIRDGKLDQLRAVAKQFGVEMTLGESRLVFQTDFAGQALRVREAAAAGRVTGVVPAPAAPPPKVFLAQTGVRFNAPANGRTAAFLDAVRDTGVEDISDDPKARPGVAAGLVQQASEILGFGTVQTLDEGVWSAAEAEAVRNARTTASALAQAAGRTLGPARSILLLSRSIANGEAVVSVAIRFSLAS